MNISSKWLRSAIAAAALTLAAGAAQAASWSQILVPGGGYDYYDENDSGTYTHLLNTSDANHVNTGGSWSAFKAAYTLTSATLKLYFADDDDSSYEYVSYRVESNNSGGWGGWVSGGEVDGDVCYSGGITNPSCRAGYDVIPDLGISVLVGLLSDDTLSYQIRADNNGDRFSNGDFYFKGSILEVTGVPTEVPEPASLALLGLGLAGMGFARRRRTS